MTPELDPRQLNAFIDGELDLHSQLEIEARLVHDAGLRAQVEALRGLRQAVMRHADYHAAPAALRARIEVLGAGPASAPAPTRPGRSAWPAAVQRWFAWRPLVASFGVLAVLTVALNLALLQSGRDEALGQEVIASQVRATLTQHLVDVASSDHHTVKPWLSARLDFSPPVPELNLPGSTFLGGRVDYLDGRPVAVLVYRQGAHIVNSFVWPGAGDSRIAFVSQRGFHLAHWSRGGMTHWVVSDVSPDEFATVVHAIDHADESH
ncbi:MAG: anti-sigma factor [Rhodoferax sp.]|nr:anti-sigma factor [Rhodoferax sp.]